MKSIKNMTLAAILIALGIVIPMLMPKLVIGPASYTPASHVPVFVAMFVSPAVAVAVVLGTAWGFLISTTPVIAMRALSHIVFALLGALYIQKNRQKLSDKKTMLKFNIIIGLIHASVECISVLPFYFSGSMAQNIYQSGFFYSIIILIGFGGFIHSLVDFIIAEKVVDRLPLKPKA
ncbi:MAG: hypothetical protein RR565_00250 [Erysipelothrix sp.]